MPPTTSPRSLGRTLAASAAALLLTAGGLLVATPASAHDELVSSDPAADSSVAALPDELTLTFSGELATDPGATELQITDAAGTDLADGDPSIVETVLTQPLAGAASGAVTVLWKVVSSDGHPISGEFAFTVTAPPTPTASASATPTATATAAPTEEPSTEPTAAPTEPPADEDSTLGDVWPWVIVGLLLAAVGGAVVYLLASRARREKALAENRERALGDGSGPGSRPGSPPPADR